MLIFELRRFVRIKLGVNPHLKSVTPTARAIEDQKYRGISLTEKFFLKNEENLRTRRLQKKT